MTRWASLAKQSVAEAGFGEKVVTPFDHLRGEVRFQATHTGVIMKQYGRNDDGMTGVYTRSACLCATWTSDKFWKSEVGIAISTYRVLRRKGTQNLLHLDLRLPADSKQF